MRVLFLCGDKKVAAPVIRAIAKTGIDVVTSPDAVGLLEVDAIVFWHDESPKVSGSRRVDLLGFYSRVPVLIATRLKDAPIVSDTLRVGAGFVLVDANLARLSQIVSLTQAGYIVLPKECTIGRRLAGTKTLH